MGGGGTIKHNSIKFLLDFIIVFKQGTHVRYLNSGYNTVKL